VEFFYYIFFSPLDVPSSPGNLSVRNVRSRSAVLSWEPALRQVSVEWLTECKKITGFDLNFTIFFKIYKIYLKYLINMQDKINYNKPYFSFEYSVEGLYFIYSTRVTVPSSDLALPAPSSASLPPPSWSQGGWATLARE
jgi:hypothetical protein